MSIYRVDGASVTRSAPCHATGENTRLQFLIRQNIQLQYLEWQEAHHNLLEFLCAKRYDEPERAKIVFSKGFHDIKSLIVAAQNVIQENYDAPPAILSIVIEYSV